MAETTSSLSEQAYLEIRESILDMRFQAGQHLSEAKLAEWLDMSRTPVRDAIRRLTREGLVRVLPRVGIFVTELDVDSVRMRMLVVGALQGLQARLAAEQLDGDQRRRLTSLVSRLHEVGQTGDYEALIELDDELHLLIDGVIDCEFLTNLVSTARAPNERVRRLIQRDPALVLEIAEMHASLGQAVLDGDGDGAERMSRDIAARFASVLVDALNKWVVPLRQQF